MKQTAVDFLDFKFLVERRMIKEDFQMVELCEIFDKAFEMQKEQIIDAYKQGTCHHGDGYTATEYYEETYVNTEK
jgi:hypothetical protein